MPALATAERPLPVRPVAAFASCAAARVTLGAAAITVYGLLGALVTAIPASAFTPGMPVLEPGFPIVLASPAASPPAICELDGDPQSEIVFAEADGNIEARNHNGALLPGWPVDIGDLPTGAAVAVGDLDGDGKSEVVCGNTAGQVFVLRRDGTPFPGWPIDLGTLAPAYVCIGKLSALSHRQIVVTSGTSVEVLLPDGSSLPGFPVPTTNTLAAAAAVGDLEGNGTAEIVIAQPGFFDALRANGTLFAFRSLPGRTFSQPPSLVDVDGNGQLEIALASDQGVVYLLRADAADYSPGWPYSVPGGGLLTGVTPADIVPGGGIELVIAGRTSGVVRVLKADATTVPGWPHTVAGGIAGMPIVDTIDGVDPDVLVGTGLDSAFAWTATGAAEPGWPVALAGPCVVSAATGDLNHDGQVEEILLAGDELYVFNLGAAIQRSDPRRLWTMAQYNAERTSCLGCPPDATVDVETGGGRDGREGGRTLAGLALETPVPNPGPAPLALRFSLTAPRDVRLAVYDAAGRTVRTLAHGERAPGSYALRWDGRDERGSRMPAGVYWVRLSAVGRGASAIASVTRRAVLVP